MGRSPTHWKIKLSLLGTKNDYQLSRETGIPRYHITRIRQQNKIPAVRKQKANLEKIRTLKNYLENYKFVGFRDLYKFCKFTSIFGKTVDIKIIKNLVTIYDIKINKHSGGLLHLIKRNGKPKRKKSI